MIRIGRPALVSFSALAAFVTSTSLGRNAQAAPTSIELGLRAGYALPAGNLNGDSGTSKGLVLGDSLRGQVPLTADFGVRLSNKVYIGGYFSYGFGILPGNACTSPVSCSAHDMRFGLDASYHLLAGQALDPWVGLGAGYEILSASESAGGNSVDVTFHGFELGHVQAGVDIKGAGIGPFVMASVGEYVGGSAGDVSGAINSTALHSWIEFGLRVYFDIAVGAQNDDDRDRDGGDRTFLKPARHRPRPPESAEGEPAPVFTPATPWPAPAPPPVVFPPEVKMASRSQCSLLCTRDGTAVSPADTARVEGPLRQHLAALRACSLDADRRHESPPISVTFDASGVGHALLHLNRSSESMRGCVGRFPAAPPIPGPANATWSCEDMCN